MSRRGDGVGEILRLRLSGDGQIEDVQSGIRLIFLEKGYKKFVIVTKMIEIQLQVFN